MPRFVYKLGDNEYCYWSTVVDAPVSPMMTRDEMIEYLMDEPTMSRDPDYYDLDLRKTEERMARADKMGTSYLHELAPQTPQQLLAYNRMGPKEGAVKFQTAIKMLREERRKWREQVERRREAQRPEREKLLSYLESGRDDLDDKVLGKMYDTGVITTRELDHLKYRE